MGMVRSWGVRWCKCHRFMLSLCICVDVYMKLSTQNSSKSHILHKHPAVIVFTVWVNCTVYHLLYFVLFFYVLAVQWNIHLIYCLCCEFKISRLGRTELLIKTLKIQYHRGGLLCCCWTGSRDWDIFHMNISYSLWPCYIKRWHVLRYALSFSDSVTFMKSCYSSVSQWSPPQVSLCIKL